MLVTYDWVIGKLRQAGITNGADSVRFLLNLRTPDGQPVPTNVKSMIGMAYSAVERGRYPNLETALVNNSRVDQALLGSIQGTPAPVGTTAAPVTQTVQPATDPVYVGGSGTGQKTVAGLVPAGTLIVPVTAPSVAPAPQPNVTPTPTVTPPTRQYTPAELQAIVAKLGRGQMLTAEESAAIGSAPAQRSEPVITPPVISTGTPPNVTPRPVNVAETGPADILPGFPGSGIALPTPAGTPTPTPTPTATGIEYVKDPVTGKNILDPLGRPIAVAPGGNLADIQAYLGAIARSGSNLGQAGIANTFAVRRATTAGEQAQRKASREMYSSRQMALNALAQRGITGAPGLSVAAQRSAQAAPLANKLEALRTMQDTVDSANILLAQEQEKKRQADEAALSDLTRASLIENKLKG